MVIKEFLFLLLPVPYYLYVHILQYGQQSARLQTLARAKSGVGSGQSMIWLEPGFGRSLSILRFLYGFFVMKFCILKDLKEIIEKLGGQGIVWLGLHDDVENDCQIIEEMRGLSV